jgi:hypothetical protein
MQLVSLAKTSVKRITTELRSEVLRGIQDYNCDEHWSKRVRHCSLDISIGVRAKRRDKPRIIRP